jgi:hypothetical protein
LDISIGIEFGWQFLFYEPIDVRVNKFGAFC